MARTNWSNLVSGWKATGCTNPNITTWVSNAEGMLKPYKRDKPSAGYLQSAAFAKQGDEMYAKTFDKFVKAFAQEMSKDKVLVENPKAKAFVQGLIKDLTEEYKYWNGKPLQKQFAANAARE